MGSGWEYLGRLVLGADPKWLVQKPAPWRCRGPVAHFFAIASGLDPGFPLTLSVLSRKLTDTRWIATGSCWSIAVPSESVIRAGDFQDEYRFEFDSSELPEFSDAILVDLYENWRPEP